MEIEDAEPENVQLFKAWLLQNGASIHPEIHFRADPSGFSVIAHGHLPSDTTAVSCPFSLAITPEVALRALSFLFENEHSSLLQGWSERQLICSYICMHWVLGKSNPPHKLAHWPYLDTLPAPEKLLTPLHFTSAELEVFKGTNLYGATCDRLHDWQTEWRFCQDIVATVNQTWGNEFSWQRYLVASTYLSSRAFPSTVLSTEPSLLSTPTSHPVLLPGIDAFNHARAQPVSWVVSKTSPSGHEMISLVFHNATERGSELFNNYGPKPNSELILGYGFSLLENPDDTIVLKIGGNPAATGSQADAYGSQKKWEVGRDARGVEPVWNEVLAAVCEDPGDQTVEDELYAADMLAQMAQNLFGRLPPALTSQGVANGVRPQVALMLEHYLEGQRDILRSLIQFARNKEREAIEAAREQGVEIIEEEEEEEMDTTEV